MPSIERSEWATLQPFQFQYFVIIQRTRLLEPPYKLLCVICSALGTVSTFVHRVRWKYVCTCSEDDWIVFYSPSKQLISNTWFWKKEDKVCATFTSKNVEFNGSMIFFLMWWIHWCCSEKQAKYVYCMTNKYLNLVIKKLGFFRILRDWFSVCLNTSLLFLFKGFFQ